jgi:hypothetical protein
MAWNSNFTDRLSRNTSSYRGHHDWMASELEMTTRGLAGGISSIVNDLGFNRDLHESSTGIQKNYVNSFFGQVWGSSSTGQYGKGYVHPLMKKGQKEATWRVAGKLEDAMSGWDKYINETAEAGEFGAGLKKKVWDAMKGAETSPGVRAMGAGNRFLTRAGGMGKLISPAIAAYGVLGDAREGYEKNGIVGAVTGGVGGFIGGAIQNRIIGAALGNPYTALAIGGAALTIGASVGKMMSVGNEGNNYLRMKQMQRTSSWNRGPTHGMSSALGASMRQRSLAAMENSKFNTTRSLGHESYMISSPKSRYANSTAIGNTTPMLSY